MITVEEGINKWFIAEAVQALDLSKHGLWDNEGHDSNSSPAISVFAVTRNVAGSVAAAAAVEQCQFVSWLVTRSAAVAAAARACAVVVPAIAAVTPAIYD